MLIQIKNEEGKIDKTINFTWNLTGNFNYIKYLYNFRFQHKKYENTT